MPARKFLLLTLTVVFSWACTAQDTSRHAGFCFDVNVFAGKVIKHTPKFRLPLPDLSTGIDVNLQWRKYGRKEWEQRRRYPIVGIGITYTNYGIDSVYGRVLSIYPNIEIPLITGHRLNWTARIGDGAGFTTRHYSRLGYLDTLNNAISSTLNDYASFMTDIRYNINTHWQVQAGLNFSHISNASFRQPNLGINMAGGHIGVKYYPVSSEPKRIHRELKPLKNRWLGQFRTTIAANESNAPLGPTYPIYIATAYVSKRWISKNKVFLGADYSYHEQIFAYLRNNSFVPPGTERKEATKIAVIGGNEFLLGRIGVVLQVGYYVHQAYQSQSKYYQKLGGNFYVVQREKGPIKEAYLCAFLKTHTSTAEWAEVGFGMSF
ncbi:MAG: acyloxyacyl hydrolase [Taibaiella sp.]|nr:acyloxyacyl hydrolase [Taibaiella sp.]